MTCWSCLYYRLDGCLQNMRLYRETNAGPECPWFEYEPGSDEQVKQEEEQTWNEHSNSTAALIAT